MKFKLYTVVWSNKGREAYRVEQGDNPIISVDPDIHQLKFNVSEQKIGRPKMRWVEMYPFFDTEKEAEVFREGNDDWQVISVEVEL